MHAFIARPATALLLLCGLALPAWAGIGEWTRIGPATREVCTLAAAPSRPSTVYAGMFAGDLFQSLDGGRTWTLVHDGSRRDSRFLDVCVLAVDPTAPETVYAGSTILDLDLNPRNPAVLYAFLHDLRIFKTRNGGGNWSLLPRGRGLSFGVSGLGGQLANPTCACAVWKSADPVNPSTLYAIPGHRLHRSDDGGTTWVKTSDQKILEQDLAIDPLNPAIVYAGAAGGVARSADRGQTWEVRGQGLPAASFVRQVEVDPTRTTTLYAAVSDFQLWPANSVYKSTDSGQTWVRLSQELREEMQIFDLVLDPLDPSILYIATLDYGVLKLTQEAP
ncbi:MAG TPA: hypothetical protein VMW27_28280 [Thermoanaerobaculia bacterium]|nr:hypothetical protein [Thermoanaerobaculia bacterium]